MHDVPPHRNEPETDLRLGIGGPPGSGKTTLTERLISEQGLVIEAAAPARDLCLIVAEASKGLTEELRREIAIACTSGAEHLLLAVNKLDLVGWDRKAYEAVVKDFKAFAARFEGTSAIALPVSALTGDNVLAHGVNTPWYDGPTLAACLQTLKNDPQRAARPLRLPIEAVLRPDPDHRHYSGTILSGTLRRGDVVQVAVSGVASAVARILIGGRACEQAAAGDAVAVALAEHIDVGSGDILVDPAHRPEVAEQFAAHLVWLADAPLLPGRDYTLRMGPREITASVTSVKYRIDVETPHHEAARTLERGEIGACTIAAAAPLAIDAFSKLPQSGRFVLSERHSEAAVAAGTVNFALRRGINVHVQPLAVSKADRAALKAQGPSIVWFTGLSGAGKSTIANLVEGKLAASGYHTYLLDGDNVRHGLNKDLGFTAADRVENIRRVGEVARLFVDAGLIVLCSFISPFRAERAAVRGLVGAAEFVEIFVDAPLDVCERRDPKGLYAKSRAGSLPNFTGIDSPYERPERPDLVLDTAAAAADDLADRVVALLKARGIVAAPSPNKH
jgi:bifunctional enzyme CysN/CysC